MVNTWLQGTHKALKEHALNEDEDDEEEKHVSKPSRRVFSEGNANNFSDDDDDYDADL